MSPTDHIQVHAAYLGPKGVLAQLLALREDPSFTHLVLRGCGVQRDAQMPCERRGAGMRVWNFWTSGKTRSQKAAWTPARGTGRGDAEPEASRVRRVLLRARIL